MAKLWATLIDGPLKGEVVQVLGVCYQRAVPETRKDTRRYPKVFRIITYWWDWDGERVIGRMRPRREKAAN